MPRSRAALSFPGDSPRADGQGMPARYEYRLAYHQPHTPERVEKFNAELDRMAAQGWVIHTCDTSSHPDVQILWHRALPWPEQEQESDPASSTTRTRMSTDQYPGTAGGPAEPGM